MSRLKRTGSLEARLQRLEIDIDVLSGAENLVRKLFTFSWPAVLPRQFLGLYPLCACLSLLRLTLFKPFALARVRTRSCLHSELGAFG